MMLSGRSYHQDDTGELHVEVPREGLPCGCATKLGFALFEHHFEENINPPDVENTCMRVAF